MRGWHRGTDPLRRALAQADTGSSLAAKWCQVASSAGPNMVGGQSRERSTTDDFWQ
jgi:hypothetical protein